MVPFYIYYSMFGFQRVGDFLWAAGDMQARGFLLGGTAGRTTLAGEGLQHQDGHSQLVATTIPNCRAYDPTYAYELAVIIQDGLRRMYVQNENIFYYISLMNENYAQPALPAGVESGILRGGYRVRTAGSPAAAAQGDKADEGDGAGKAGKADKAGKAGKGKDSVERVTLLGSGTILRECLAAAELLEQQFGVAAEVFSITSFSELRREALACDHWNLLHPAEAPRVPYVRELLGECAGPLIAATDYVRNVPEQIRAWLSQRYVTMGTDGFGRSDARGPLRSHFEVDRAFISLAALKALADQGRIEPSRVADALGPLGIDAEKADPITS